MDFSPQERFTRGIFGTGNFRQEEFLAPKHFFTGIIWHLGKQYGCRFGKDILAPVLLCRNVHVPKCPHAKMFLCRKFLVPKSPGANKSPYRNVLVLSCQSAGTSAVPNGAHTEMFPWWNICAEMTLAKMFHAKMVYIHNFSSFSYFISNSEQFVMLSLFHVKALVWSEKWQPSMLTDVVFSSSYPKLLWK